MSGRNDPSNPAERSLDRARREHGRGSPEAAVAAEVYGHEMDERITAEVKQGAAHTQQGWDRHGTPLWMRIKAALGLAGRRG